MNEYVTTTAYKRARKSINPHSNRADSRAYISKWRKKENIELIKKALDVFKETSDIHKAADILNIKASTLRGYIACPYNEVYKYFKPYKHLLNANFDKHEHAKKAVDRARAGARKHRQSCKDAGLDYKSYFSHLKQTCPDKRTTTQEIKSLNESINYLIDAKKSEQELKVLREKLRLAKQFFKNQSL